MNKIEIRSQCHLVRFASIAYSCEINIVDAGRHRRTPWTPARGGEWWMGLKSVDIDLILSNMLVGQWTVVRSVLDE